MSRRAEEGSPDWLAREYRSPKLDGPFVQYILEDPLHNTTKMIVL